MYFKHQPFCSKRACCDNTIPRAATTHTPFYTVGIKIIPCHLRGHLAITRDIFTNTHYVIMFVCGPLFMSPTLQDTVSRLVLAQSQQMTLKEQ